MAIGRSSPRYQGLARLYSNPDRIRKYLAEHFILIVNICHQFLSFSQKSVLGQLTSSITDAYLRQAEAKLDEWVLNIKEEVEFLNTKVLVNDAQEVSKLRSLVDLGYHSRMHQRNIKKRLKWLDACTTYDYETAWKQARKCGNATIFAENEQYQDWKSCLWPTSATLVVSGKLGAGKTVLTANIVDDLNLTCGESVAYFFCRHGNMYSCQARTALGSLCCQLLQSHLADDTMDQLLSEDVKSLSYNDLVTRAKAILAHETLFFFVLDGLDDCDDIERRQITTTLHQLQKDSVLYLLISLRSRPDDVESNYRNLRPHINFKIRENSPDIGSFINSELTAWVEAGELVLGNPGIILEIREALCSSTQGM